MKHIQITSAERPAFAQSGEDSKVEQLAGMEQNLAALRGLLHNLKNLDLVF